MIHVRTDDCETPGERKFACGITELAAGDQFYFEGEAGAWLRADCEGCNPGGPKRLGTPISELSGRPGHRGFEAFTVIAESWGHD